MPRRRAVPLFPVLLVALMVAGCGAKPEPVDALQLASANAREVAPEADPRREGSAEPADFVAPTLSSRLVAALVPSLVASQPLNPALWALDDGRLLLATPTCDRPEPAGTEPQEQLDQPRCNQRIVYLSDAEAGAWKRLNKDPQGRLTAKQDKPRGHVDAAADAAGSFYVIMDDPLYNDVFLYRSHDDGATWDWMPLAVDASGTTRDQGTQIAQSRIAAAGNGRLILAWRECDKTGGTCRVGIQASHTDATAWSRPWRFGDHVRAVGPIALGPDGQSAHLAFIEGQGPGELALKILSTPDFGIGWTQVETPLRVRADTRLSTERGAAVATPGDAALGDGGLALAWTETVATPGDAAAVSHRARYAIQPPGAEWGAPIDLPQLGATRFPWLVAGAGDRFALFYWSNPTPTTGDAAAWDLSVRIVDGEAGAWRTLDAPIAARVHVGALCGGENECRAANPRFALDFFEADARPDGRLVVAYPSSSGPNVELRVAVQMGGSPLFVPRPA